MNLMQNASNLLSLAEDKINFIEERHQIGSTKKKMLITIDVDLASRDCFESDLYNFITNTKIHSSNLVLFEREIELLKVKAEKLEKYKDFYMMFHGLNQELNRG